MVLILTENQVVKITATGFDIIYKGKNPRQKLLEYLRTLPQDRG